MAHAIAWIFEALLRLWLPLSGRHRPAESDDDGPAAHQYVPMMLCPARVPDVPVPPGAADCVNGSTMPFRPISGLSDSHGAGLARLYAVAHERRRESRPRARMVRASHGRVVVR